MHSSLPNSIDDYYYSDEEEPLRKKTDLEDQSKNQLNPKSRVYSGLIDDLLKETNLSVTFTTNNNVKNWPPSYNYNTYLHQNLEQNPNSIVEAAEFFFSQQNMEIGIRVLSSVVELELENPQFYR